MYGLVGAATRKNIKHNEQNIYADNMSASTRKHMITRLTTNRNKRKP